jgi:hypothetical protein
VVNFQKSLQDFKDGKFQMWKMKII